jgi:hypothetical protein
LSGDIAWWVEGKDEHEVGNGLTAAAEASLQWAAHNGVAFDHGKTEAVFLSRRRAPPSDGAKIKVGTGRCRFQGSNLMARSLARLPTDPEGAPLRQAKEGKKRPEPAPPAHRAGGLVTGQLAKGCDGMCLVNRNVRLGALVEGKPDPRHH